MRGYLAGYEDISLPPVSLRCLSTNLRFQITNTFEVAIGEIHVVYVFQALGHSVQLCPPKLIGVQARKRTEVTSSSLLE